MNAEGTVRSIFVTGLKNAHAIENHALSIIKPQVSRIENYPEDATRLDQHIHKTETQIARLNQLLSDFAEDRSALKDVALSLTSATAATGQTVAADEILKYSFANFAFEQVEIAASRSLLTVAEQGGFSASSTALRANLDEKEKDGRLDRTTPVGCYLEVPLAEICRRNCKGLTE
ncbi:DUF892 family protein [Pararhizobium arenae]|uniref:DUF892 family protein n=1 Tax=Pararhizobium arenae TaxID=1856850 RepID=UPI000B04C183